MVWTGALVVACLSAVVCANCGSQCTDTTFRGYASCLKNCGANVAVTTCDCSAMACSRCPGDNSCCQTCCNLKQCVCSNVNCQQPCNNACCAKCCQPPVEQPQCGNCGTGCQQAGGNCAPGCQQTGGNCPTGCQQPGGNCPTGCQQTGGNCPTGCQQPGGNCPTGCQQTGGNCPTGCQQTGGNCPTGCQQPGPGCQQPTTTTTPPPPAVPDTIHVNVSWPPQPPSVVNISLGDITVLPPNINVLPPNISFTPNITVVVNTSPVSQVYPYQYAGNVSLSIEQQVQQLPPLNCTGGRRRCCRVVMAPSYPCPPGMNCPPIVRMACGDQCSTIVQQPVYYQPRPTYYPVYYYRPVHVYVPVQQPPQVFCSSGCVPTPSWPFARCYDTPGFMPYSASGASSTMPYSASGASWTMPYSASGASLTMPYSASGASWSMPYSASAVPSMQQFGNLELAPEAAEAAAATATATSAQG